jgi:LacI family transcriptional regulator
MPVTIYDISRELNLSAMTVSRVLNQRPGVDRVAPATRERVERAAREMGYRPNRAARALVTGRTHTVALWISHIRSSVYSQIVEACRAAAYESGMELNVVEMAWHFAEPGSHRQFAWPVDGVIAVDPPASHELLSLLGEGPWRTAPRVHIGSGTPVRWGGDYVHVDMSAGARVAIAHLIGQGCQRIAYAVPTYLARPGFGHYDAYVDMMTKAGLTPEFIRHDDWRLPTVRRVTCETVANNGRPDGIFCHNDEIAIATFRGLRDCGVRVPQETALIGCEGNEFLEFFDPPLSSVAMPIAQLCWMGWETLQRRIEAPEAAAQQVTLPFEFMARESAHWGMGCVEIKP